MENLKIPTLPRNLIKKSEIVPLFVPLAEISGPDYTERISAMYLGTIGSLVKIEQVDADGDIINTTTSYIMNIVVVKDEEGHFHLYNDYDTSVDDQNSLRYYQENGTVKFANITEEEIEELPNVDEEPPVDISAAEDIIKEDIKELLDEEVDDNDESELAEADTEGDGCEPESEAEDGTEDDNVGPEESAVEAEPEQEEALTPEEIRNRTITKGNKPELPDFSEDEQEQLPEAEPKQEAVIDTPPKVEKKAPVEEKVDIEHDTTYVHPKTAEAPDDFASQIVTERPVKDFAANDLKEKSQRPQHNDDKDAELARRRAEWKKKQEAPTPKKHFIGDEKANKPYQPKQDNGASIKMPSSELDDVF